MLQGLFQGILKVLLLGIGRLLIYFGYGAKGMAAKKKLGGGEIGAMESYLLGGGFLVWVICLIVLLNGRSSNVDNTLCAIIVAIGALAYSIWFIFARKSAKRHIEATNNKTLFECVVPLVPETIIKHCESVSDNPNQLRTYLSECVNQRLIQKRHAEIILDEYTRRSTINRSSLE